jgi:hypothetical protein
LPTTFQNTTRIVSSSIFLKDKDFHQEANLNKNPSHIVVYTEQNSTKPVTISDDKGSEDLNMREAITKYGNLKITAVHTVISQ